MFIYRRIYRDNIEKLLGICKESKRKIILREPKGEKVRYQAKQGPTRWKTRPNPNQTYLQMASTPAGMAHIFSEAHQNKIGLRRLLQGVAAPMGRLPPYGRASSPSFARRCIKRASGQCGVVPPNIPLRTAFNLLQKKEGALLIHTHSTLEHSFIFLVVVSL